MNDKKNQKTDEKKGAEKKTPQLENRSPREVLAAIRKQLDKAPAGSSHGGLDSAAQQLEHLLDSGSFLEFEPLVDQKEPNNEEQLPERLLTGTGTINGRQVTVAGLPDFDRRQLSHSTAEKLTRLFERAREFETPIILMLNSASIGEKHDISDLSAWARSFKTIVKNSPQIPIISLFFKPISQFTSLFSPLSDFVIGLEKNFTEKTARPELDLLLDSPGQIIETAIKILNYLPDTSSSLPFVLKGKAPGLSSDPGELVPLNKSQPYDVLKLIETVVDEDSFLELQPRFARNLCTGLARIDGRALGILANQPKKLAGGLNPAGAEKALRFIELCEKFNLPLLRLVDQPGLLDETSEPEVVPYYRMGKLFKALSQFSGSITTVITRKAYNLSFLLFGNRFHRSDFTLAWPEAEIGPANLEKAPNDESDYYQYADPWEAARQGLIDDIIEPQETRDKIATFLKLNPHSR